MARFSRKDYEDIADLFRNVRGDMPEAKRVKAIKQKADFYAKDNPRFDRARFFAACEAVDS